MAIPSNNNEYIAFFIAQFSQIQCSPNCLSSDKSTCQLNIRFMIDLIVVFNIFFYYFRIQFFWIWKVFFCFFFEKCVLLPGLFYVDFLPTTTKLRGPSKFLYRKPTANNQRSKAFVLHHNDLSTLFCHERDFNWSSHYDYVNRTKNLESICSSSSIVSLELKDVFCVTTISISNFHTRGIAWHATQETFKKLCHNIQLNWDLCFNLRKFILNVSCVSE